MDLQEIQIDRSKAAASRRGRRNPWPLRLGLLAVLGVLAWLFGPVLVQWSDRLRLPEVRTAVVQRSAPAAAAAVSGTAANGYVVAARRAALSSDVPGRIVEMRVTEGSVVQRGDIVARLYSDEFRAALDRAKADLEVANAGVERARRLQAAAAGEEQQLRQVVATQQALLDESEAQRDWAQAEFARVDDLVQREIASPRELDKARSDLNAAAARVTSLESAMQAAAQAVDTAALRVQVAASDLALAEAQQSAAAAGVQQAQATLDKTDVRAPFDGIVVLKDAEVGEVVSPNVQGGSNARGAVCTMVDFDSLEVQANVPETTLAAVRLGAPADVFLDAFPDRRLAGVVDRIWPTADRQKATVEVRVRLRERSDELRPEMGVRVVFRSDDDAAASGAADAAAGADDGAQAPVLLVPENALVEATGRTGAFVVERDTVRFVEVRIGERRSGRAAVEQGLRPGQRLVLDPPATLADGDRIRLADG
ncbi:MAG: efflux RND transporter periplasmic adaptor subunit [Planctomycetota bacterium]